MSSGNPVRSSIHFPSFVLIQLHDEAPQLEKYRNKYSSFIQPLGKEYRKYTHITNQLTKFTSQITPTNRDHLDGEPATFHATIPTLASNPGAEFRGAG